MVSPTVTPEHGVTRYQHDRTQGPACAIAAGAATIYRNYFAPVDGRDGQTAERQFDGLADLGEALGEALNKPVKALWKMQNGYALCSRAGLDTIADYLGKLEPAQVDITRGKLCIGVHRDVEVTDAAGGHRPLVSQAFCSALPVAYTRVPPSHWEPFASLVLQAAYEATMLAAVLTAQLECLLDDVVVGKQEMVGAIDAACSVAEQIIGKLKDGTPANGPTLLGAAVGNGHGTFPPTPAMKRFADSIARQKRIKPPPGNKTSISICRKFLNEHAPKTAEGETPGKLNSKPPSLAQMLYAKKIAQGKGVVIPEEAKGNSAAMSAWINSNRSPKRRKRSRKTA